MPMKTPLRATALSANARAINNAIAAAMTTDIMLKYFFINLLRSLRRLPLIGMLPPLLLKSHAACTPSHKSDINPLDHVKQMPLIIGLILEDYGRSYWHI